MNGRKRPMSSRNQDELSEDDYETKEERNHSTGATEKVTYYSDGSCTRHGGGPAGPMSYDKHGEEC